MTCFDFGELGGLPDDGNFKVEIPYLGLSLDARDELLRLFLFFDST